MAPHPPQKKAKAKVTAKPKALIRFSKFTRRPKPSWRATANVLKHPSQNCLMNLRCQRPVTATDAWRRDLRGGNRCNYDAPFGPFFAAATPPPLDASTRSQTLRLYWMTHASTLSRRSWLLANLWEWRSSYFEFAQRITSVN